MTLPLTCLASSHPATESGGFTCARYQGEPPSCRDCAAIILGVWDDCARVFADMMSPANWGAVKPSILSADWQERLWAEAEEVDGYRGITIDPRLVIYDECTAAPGGHGIPQSAYTPTSQAAPWT